MNNLQLKINFNIKDPESMKQIEFNFMHSKHSFQRASQRGIRKRSIEAAIRYGKDIYRQGYIFYVLGENNIPVSLNKEREQLRNTVVVVSEDTNQVVTCYRSPDPFRRIKIKPKKLCGLNRAA